MTLDLGGVPYGGGPTLSTGSPATEVMTEEAAVEVAERAADGAWLVALDVDGTLMSFDEFISEEVRESVTALREAGHEVVIATGRPLVGALPVVRELGIDSGWVVSSNGSVTARLDPSLPGGYVVVDVVRFDPRAALAVMSEHMPSAHIAMEEVGVGFWVTSGFPRHGTHGTSTVVPVEHLGERDAIRVVVSEAPAPTRELEQRVHELGLVVTSFFISATRWLDVAPRGVTKASALERLRALCKVPPERTVAIGDGENDLEMLGWAARGVAMGHAEASVIAAADEVTLSIVDDGAVPVLRSILGQGRTRP